MKYVKNKYICSPVIESGMKHSREFNIAFVGLKPGLHVFNYSITDSFFDRFEKTEFSQSEIDIKLTFDKKQGIFLLHFEITGVVKIMCDRCGEEFNLSIWDEFDLVVKQLDDNEVTKKSEEDAEVAYIGKSESLLDVAPWIYEFVVLSIPMQHIHPNDENGESTCNPTVLKYLNHSSDSSTVESNSVWNKLKNEIK